MHLIDILKANKFLKKAIPGLTIAYVFLAAHQNKNKAALCPCYETGRNVQMSRRVRHEYPYLASLGIGANTIVHVPG